MSEDDGDGGGGSSKGGGGIVEVEAGLRRRMQGTLEAAVQVSFTLGNRKSRTEYWFNWLLGLGCVMYHTT